MGLSLLVVAAGVGYLILISGQIQANADAKPGAIENFITIQPNWPGLVELLFAGLGKSKALIWVRAAQDSLGQFLGGTLSAGDVGLIGTALSVHFHISSASSLENRTLINQILTTYGLIADALNQSPVKFRFRSDAEANADLAGGSGFDAYTFFGGTMNFTKLFPQRRRLARAAIILHEAVHAVDNDSGRQTPTGALAVDIPEWYVTDAEAERLGLPIQANRSDLGARYDTLSAADAIHNPSAYSAFAQHVSMGSDVRFGSVNQGPE